MAQNHIEQNEAPMTRGGTIQGPSRRYRRLRHPTFPADEWTANNPLLQRGELGIESDTHQIKAGDGYTLWNDLPYASSSGDEYVLKTGDTMSGALNILSETQQTVSLFSIRNGDTAERAWLFAPHYESCVLDLKTGPSFGTVYSFTNTFFRPNGTKDLGTSINKWQTIYVTKINNGADIAVPETGGTMVVATPPAEAGTYVLKAVVDGDGNITTQWVAE